MLQVALPANPNVKRDDRSYYEPYGFRMYGDLGPEGTEPQPIKLDLCYDGLTKVGIDAKVWPKDRLEEAFAKAGFMEIKWPKHVFAAGEPMGAEFWEAFSKAPSMCTMVCKLAEG